MEKSEKLKSTLERDNKRKMIYHWKGEKKNFTKKKKKKMYYMKGEKTIKEWRSKETAEVTESKRETEVIG